MNTEAFGRHEKEVTAFVQSKGEVLATAYVKSWLGFGTAEARNLRGMDDKWYWFLKEAHLHDKSAMELTPEGWAAKQRAEAEAQAANEDYAATMHFTYYFDSCSMPTNPPTDDDRKLIEKVKLAAAEYSATRKQVGQYLTRAEIHRLYELSEIGRLEESIRESEEEAVWAQIRGSGESIARA